MNIILKILTIIILISLITACRIDAVDILQQETRLTLLQYNDTVPPSPVVKMEILKGSEKYYRLLTWLEKNNDGWQPSYVTYAPYIVVSGEKFNLNFQGSRAIINYEVSAGKWRQYLKNIEENDFFFLINEATNNQTLAIKFTTHADDVFIKCKDY